MVLVWQPAGSNRGPQGIQGVPGPQGADGPAGPSGITTLRGATDYDDAVAPIEGDAILWVASGSKFSPVRVLDANGRHLSSKMPLVSSSIRLGNVSVSVVSDASSGAGNLLNINANGNITVDPPSNPTDFQALRYHIVANNAARTVTFGSGILAAKNLPLGLGPYSLAQGDVLAAVLEYIGNHQTAAGASAPAWGLLAAAIV